MTRGRVAAGIVVGLVLAWLMGPEAPETSVVAVPDRPSVETTPTPVTIAEPDVLGARPPGERRMTVRCPLPVTVDDGRIEIVIEDAEGNPKTTRGSIDDDMLQFMSHGPDGAGLVTLPGFEKAGFLWFSTSDGTPDCLFPTDPTALPTGILRLLAPNHDGSSVLEFEVGKKSHRYRGEPLELELPMGKHRLQVCETAPLGYRCSYPERIEVLEGRVTEVEPQLPSADVGGLGVSIQPDALGLVLTQIADDSPFAELGLRPRDRVTAVNGVSARNWNKEALHLFENGEGPVEVSVQFYDGGQEHGLILER